MKELVRQRATVIFGVLVAITFVSFWLTVGHGGAELHQSASVVWTAIIVLAAVKVRWVMLDFMELRSATVPLKVLFEGWILTVAGVLIAISWLVA